MKPGISQQLLAVKSNQVILKQPLADMAYKTVSH